MTKMNTHRRGLLRLGAAAALAPFVPTLASDAEAAGPVKRLILFYLPIGTYMPNWRPVGTETSFTLGKVLAPLEKYKSKMLVLDGLDNAATIIGPAGHGHEGINSLWTGSPHGPGAFVSGANGAFGWPTGPSVDQAVAAAIAKTVSLKFNSIETAFNLQGQPWGSRMIFKGADQPVAPVTDPQALYRSLFSDLKLNPTELDAIQKARKSVIDVVLGDLNRLRGRISAVDRPKLDAHLDGLRTIEAKLSVGVSACSSVPVAQAAASGYPAVLDAQSSLVVSAMGCDLTRVASFMPGSEIHGVGTPSFLSLGEAHHVISHRGDTVGYDGITKISTWYMQQVAVLADRLAAVREGNATMLDNTLIVVAGPMGDPALHTSRCVPAFLLGGAAGALRTGRYLKFGSPPAVPRSGEYGGRSFNDLLVSVLNIMGIPVTTFGDKRVCAGPLPGMA